MRKKLFNSIIGDAFDMYIFHGDNHIASRQALLEYIDSSRERFTQTTTYLATDLTPAQLESALGEVSLFNEQVLTVVEELHSLPKSAHQTALLNMLMKSQTIESVVLWEKKLLTPNQLATFNQAKQKTFKSSKSLFQWLDAFSTATSIQARVKLFNEAITQDGTEYCFLMLVRQIRLLLTIKGGGTIAGPPFVQAKIQKQSKMFSLQQLLNLHEKLTCIDVESKTSGIQMSLKNRLDLLQIEL